MEKLVEIINAWDPIGVFPMAPKDEYSNEINQISEYLNNAQSVNIENLAKVINEVFINAFGTEVYVENVEKCKGVAEKIVGILEI